MNRRRRSARRAPSRRASACAAGAPTVDDRRRSPASTSSAVVVRPSVSRSAPRPRSLGTPIAGEHVRRLHRPAGARRRRAGAHAGLVEQVQQRLVLDAVDADVRRAGDLVGARHGLVHVRRAATAGRRPASRAARRSGRSRRPARCRWPAAPRPSRRCPATLCVPLRRSRSCPPPTSIGANAAPPRATSTPTPFGPPNLCADSDSRSTCGVIARAGRASSRLHGVGVQHRVRARTRRTTAATAARSVIVPTSLLTAITLTTDTSRRAPSPSRRDRHGRPCRRRRHGRRTCLDRVQHGVVLDGGAQRPGRRGGRACRRSRCCRPRCRRW